MTATVQMSAVSITVAGRTILDGIHLANGPGGRLDPDEVLALALMGEIYGVAVDGGHNGPLVRRLNFCLPPR